MTAEIRFTTIEVHTSPWEAHVSRGLLESEGIPVFLLGEHHVGAYWPLSQALGGVGLQVPDEYAVQALDVLARRNSGELEAALVEQTAFRPPVCRACGGTEWRDARTWSDILFSVVFIFFSNTIFPPPKERRCVACGGTTVAEP